MSIRKNMLSNMLLTSSTVIFPLITFPYITRTLSNENLGKYFFIDALTQYLILFSAIGIPFYGVREIAKVKDDPAQRSKIVAELLLIQFTLAVILSLLLIGVYRFVPMTKNDFGLVKVTCLAVIGSAFLMEWFYQGIENFAYITTRSLILKALSVVSILLLVRHGDDYVLYYFLTTALILGNALLNLINYLRKYHTAFSGKLAPKQHLKPLLLLFSVNVAISVYAILDTLILGLLTGPAMVSYYSVPLKVAKIYWMVVNGAGMVLIPRVTSYFLKEDFAGIQELLKKSISIVGLLTIPFCFFCVLFPAEILTTVAGAQYLPASNALRILSVLPLIISICNVCGTQFLMPIGAEKSILYATILGLIISLMLNFLLIPYLGYLGAVLACVSAESVVCIYIFRAARRKISIQVDYALLAQILLSLFVVLISQPVLTFYFTGITTLLISVAIYSAGFLFLQVVYFKNTFVYSLVNFRRKSN